MKLAGDAEGRKRRRPTREEGRRGVLNYASRVSEIRLTKRGREEMQVFLRVMKNVLRYADTRRRCSTWSPMIT